MNSSSGTGLVILPVACAAAVSCSRAKRATRIGRKSAIRAVGSSAVRASATAWAIEALENVPS